jgi:hypothetical protein
MIKALSPNISKVWLVVYGVMIVLTHKSQMLTRSTISAHYIAGAGLEIVLIVRAAHCESPTVRYDTFERPFVWLCPAFFEMHETPRRELCRTPALIREDLATKRICV